MLGLVSLYLLHGIGGGPGSPEQAYLFQSESFHQGSCVVRKEWEGEAWPRVIVWYLYRFIVTAFLHLRVLEESLCGEFAVQEVPWSGWKGSDSLSSDVQSVGNTKLSFPGSYLKWGGPVWHQLQHQGREREGKVTTD